ncbi:Uma2 family endonuclease [Candidatus Poribacteria bacterium]|nr:Uma2 family endonuclease [Candidatus Poribacteria bacterium]MXV82827.1 Uma2 family endonuclease [Candidatus Poribacteria bacterium]MYA55576.1 Uma2 family endonuclease [Candidatus Poribacteria bacterium]
MSSIAARTYLTPEEYIAVERKATLKSEYLSGEIVAMSGASNEHNLITMNTANGLYNQVTERGCRVYGSDMRVGISTGVSYFYPDVTIVCDEPRFEDDVFDTLINPRVVIEVLSDSTANYDRGEKFIRYRQLESLQEYILISQDQVHIEHYLRQGKQWILSEFSALENVLPLVSIEAELSLGQVYRFVEFETDATAQTTVEAG